MTNKQKLQEIVNYLTNFSELLINEKLDRMLINKDLKSKLKRMIEIQKKNNIKC